MAMKTSATFLNAVMDVRIEHGAFHFSLGEMAPGRDANVEFIPAFRGVLAAEEAPRFFSYLLSKAEAGVSRQASDTSLATTRVAKNEVKSPPPAYQDPLDGQSNEKAVKRRVIAVSDGGTHLK